MARGRGSVVGWHRMHLGSLVARGKAAGHLMGIAVSGCWGFLVVDLEQVSCFYSMKEVAQGEVLW